MEICAKINKAISGMKEKLLQKNAIEAPKATDGTIRGIFTKTSRIVEVFFPARLRAMSTAMGKPKIVFIKVARPATNYDSSKLPQ